MGGKATQMKVLLLQCLYYIFNLGFPHGDVLNRLFQSCSVPSSAPQTGLEILPRKSTETKNSTARYKRTFGKPDEINKANYTFWSQETQAKHVKIQDLY